MLHLLWHFLMHWLFSFMQEVTNLKCWRVNVTANQRVSAVFFHCFAFWLIFTVCLAARSFSSLCTFYYVIQLWDAILSNSYTPWRAAFSNVFSTENSLSYATMTIETVFDLHLWWFLWILPTVCRARHAADLQTVNKVWRTSHRARVVLWKMRRASIKMGGNL